MKYNRSNQRNGVTLLMVMTVLVLFLLMGTTFMIVTNNFLKSARQRSKFRLKGDDAQVLVERALYDIIRGPDLNNTMSPLRGHSLLGDMYGYGFTGQVAGTPAFVADTGQQFIEFDLNLDPTLGSDPTNIRTGASAPLSQRPDFYNGLVLSFVGNSSKPGVLNAALSGRIIRYEPPAKFTVMLDQWEQELKSDLSPLEDAEVVINSRPFSGFGAGDVNSPSGGGVLQPSDGQLGDKALQPNRQGFNKTTLVDNNNGYLSRNNSPNESYDAADFQNMFLFGRKRGSGAERGEVIPSFFRESLANANNFILPNFQAEQMMVDNDGDGEPDSYWMDIGLPVQSDGSGRLYKPMVAYRVEDLDGRLNLNVHGNLAQEESVTRGDLLGGGQAAPASHALGQGYGPAEISMKDVLGAEHANILQGRYRSQDPHDTVPGKRNTWDPWSKQKLFGYARGSAAAGGAVGHSFGTSAMDLRGQYAVGTPQNSLWSDPNFPNFSNGLPVADVLGAAWSDELVDNPYESSVYWAKDDSPYGLNELERVLRPFDSDTNLLPDRLVQLAPNAFSNLNNKRKFTTDSFEVPMVPVGMINQLAGKLIDSNPSPIDDNGLDREERMALAYAYIKENKLLPDEFFAGLKMNVNRAFGNGYDDNGNGVVDESEEAVQSNTDVTGTPVMDLDNGGDFAVGDQNARYHFAKQLYIMALLQCPKPNDASINLNDYRRQLAQWAVNVVDFRDPDSIMTPFDVDFNPWDGWNPSPNNRIWGCERPELLLTESIALHDRRTEDLATPDNLTTENDDDDKDEDFDQRYRPNTATFIELYNPWTQNRLNQVIPPSLTDDPSGVRLGKTHDNTPGGTPVWRIKAEIPIYDDPGSSAYERAIYFTNNDPGALGIAGSYFWTDATNIKAVSPGEHAVVGSSNQFAGGKYTSYVGRRTGMLAVDSQTRHIALQTGNNALGTVTAFPPGESRPEDAPAAAADPAGGVTRAVVVPINQPRSLSVSDPSGGYPLVDASGIDRTPVTDGWQYANPFDEPLDPFPGVNPLPVSAAEVNNRALWTNGLTDNFRVLHLQRLANPLEAWNKDDNPYISIDSIPLDLFAYNGLQPDANNNNRSGGDVIDPGHQDLDDPADNFSIVNRKSRLDSLERGEGQFAAQQQLKRLLFKVDNGNVDEDEYGQVNPDPLDHHIGYRFIHSLGGTSWNYRANLNNDPYAWLAWNNRPYVSHLELANVPISAPDKITWNFGIQQPAADPYSEPIKNGDPLSEPDDTDLSVDLSADFRYLFNPFNSEAGGDEDNATHLYRLFDYLEVPSRFVGTQTNLNRKAPEFNRNPFDFVPRYRVPGKINLNTIYERDVWKGLMGHAYGDGAPGITWSKFQKSRKGDLPDYEFAGVFRNANEGNYVPDISTSNPGGGPGGGGGAGAPSLVRDGVDCGLFRRHPDANKKKKPFFDYETGTSYNNSNRSPYFRYDMRQRLGNLVTTRSSVYAIWITVGLFEVNAQGQVTTNELGSDSGEVRRYRGFFVVDRSIPVAFEPGKNHNVERAIRVSSFLE